MRVEDLEIAKEVLETEIYHAVYTAINKFEVETGMTPDDISIYLERVSTIERPDRMILTGVKATITI